MRKNGIIETLIILICGFVGYRLRSTELATVFDSATGLAEARATVSMTLIGLSIGVCAVLLILVAMTPKLKDINYTSSFTHSTPIPCVILCLVGAAMAVIAGRWILVMNSGIKEILWSVLALASGLSIIYVSVREYQNNPKRQPGLVTTVPVIFLCLWLVFSYLDRAADPVVLNYIYEFFAIAFAIMGFYYISGFAFGKIKPKSMLFCSRVGIYFILVNLADDISNTRKGIYACIAAVLLIHTWLMSRNVYLFGNKSQEKSQEEVKTAQENQQDGFNTEDI